MTQPTPTPDLDTIQACADDHPLIADDWCQLERGHAGMHRSGGDCWSNDSDPARSDR
ncbi:hypothetical protein GCM10009759_55410 [Kitasatospora saccharophila]|uniref:Uncharacterized protein n=1 Tax=Kitasatospora saccharophila TaxID=407973 RepID=A0ABN2XJU5_9ACTN